MRRLLVLACALAFSSAAAPPGGTKTDPVTGEQTAPKDAKPAPAPSPAPEPKKEEAAPAPAPNEPQKIDPKSFDKALENYFLGYPKEAAALLFSYTEGMPQTDENYAWAQFFLAKSLIDLGLRHAGGVYLARIARERSNPAVLPKSMEELRALTDLPHDEVMIDEQVFGALDLGFLPEDIAGYAH